MKKVYCFLMLGLGLAESAKAQQPLTTATTGNILLHSCRPENPILPPNTLRAATTVPPSAPASSNALPQVRLIYLVPSDRTINPAYAAAIANAGHHIQRFYQQQLGNTKTFELHSPVVETYHTAHNSAWYQTNPNGATFSQFYLNTAQDAFAAAGGGQFNDPNNVYAIYIDDESACGQCGGCGGNGVLVVTSNDLKGLVGQPSMRFCPTDPAPVQYPPCRWVGGLGHELGHAFGLPHPPGCDQNQSTCDYNDLMWTGYASYPTTYLNAAEQAALNQSPYFTAHGPVASPATCNNLLATRAPAAQTLLNVSPNPAGISAIVQFAAVKQGTFLYVTDAQGRVVRCCSVAANATEVMVDLRSLPTGLYLLRNGANSLKLMKE